MTGPVCFPGARRLPNVLPCLALILISIFPHSGAANDPARISGGKSFFEDFTRLDQRRWFISNGWFGAGQGCVWSTGNVKLIGKTMSLVLNNRRAAGKDYSCAEVQTQGFYGHGTYEVRMRPASGSGIVSSFFSYAGPSHGAGNAQERWMSFVFAGKDLKTLHLNFFSVGGGNHRHEVQLDFDPSEAMHDYAIQWTPQSVRWHVNGRLVHTMEIGPAARAANSPGKVFFNLRNGAGDDQAAWLGPFEYAGQPLQTTYEYIAFTELDGPCQFPTSVVCKQARR